MRALLLLFFVIYTHANIVLNRDDSYKKSPILMENSPKKSATIMHKSLKLMNRRYARSSTLSPYSYPKKAFVESEYTVFPSHLHKKPLLDVPSSAFFSIDHFEEPKLRVKKVLPDYYSSRRNKRSSDKKDSVISNSPLPTVSTAKPIALSGAKLVDKAAEKVVPTASEKVKGDANPKDTNAAASALPDAKTKDSKAEVTAAINSNPKNSKAEETAAVAKDKEVNIESSPGSVSKKASQRPSKGSGKPGKRPSSHKTKKIKKSKSGRNVTGKKSKGSKTKRIRKLKSSNKRGSNANKNKTKLKKQMGAKAKGLKKEKTSKGTVSAVPGLNSEKTVSKTAAPGPKVTILEKKSAVMEQKSAKEEAKPAAAASSSVAPLNNAPAAPPATNRKVKASRRLIAARDTLIENYPYAVSIQKDEEHWCTGALLNQRLVITTANCVWKSNRMSRLKIRAGSRHTETGGQLVNIAEVMKHPKWSIRGRPDSDVALLFTDRNVRFSHSCHAVDLPNRVMMPVFDDAWITSWGAERRDGVYEKQGLTLQVYHTRLMNKEKCNNVTMRFGVQVSDNFICLEQNGKRAPCTRDTGAPAVSDGVIWGMASWGIRKLCGTERFPAMFSYIASHSNMDFIINASHYLMAEERLYPFPDRYPRPEN